MNSVDLSKLSEDQLERFIRLKRSIKQNAPSDGTHLCFMKKTWMKKTPFIVGFHTKIICKEIDQAFADFRKGISTCLLINVHHRVGKSDIVSRYLGPHFLGEFPDQEVIQCSYQANLAAQFSTFGRNIVKSDAYKALYPNVKLSQETNKKDDWVLVDASGRPTCGRLYATGLQSGLTGNGYALGILDDYCRGRAQAESHTFRDNTWDAFTNDFLTRAAPVSITIVIATQWHIDDISGRIKSAMATDPDFPKFRCVSLPAKASDYPGEGKYPGEYLFEERLGKDWYKRQYATLGPYSAASLMDCNPMLRTGGRISTDGICYVPDIKVDTTKKWARVWDLAHTAAQRSGDDPDWTSGTKLAFEMLKGDPVPYLYIADVARTREGANKRDALIKAKAITDGVYVRQAIENTIDSKDAYEYISSALKDISWTKLNLKGDKAARATPLESIFATPGHVIVKRADWNEDWINEILRFDGSGKDHDDQVDNLSAGYAMLVQNNTTFDPEFRNAFASARGR